MLCFSPEGGVVMHWLGHCHWTCQQEATCSDALRTVHKCSVAFDTRWTDSNDLGITLLIIIIIRIYLNRPELILSRGCGLAAQSWSQTSSPCLAVFGVSSFHAKWYTVTLHQLIPGQLWPAWGILRRDLTLSLWLSSLCSALHGLAISFCSHEAHPQCPWYPACPGGNQSSHHPAKNIQICDKRGYD